MDVKKLVSLIPKISIICVGQIVQYHVWRTGPHVWQTNRLDVSRTDWSSIGWTDLSYEWRTDLRRTDMCDGQIYIYASSITNNPNSYMMDGPIICLPDIHLSCMTDLLISCLTDRHISPVTDRLTHKCVTDRLTDKCDGQTDSQVCDWQTDSQVCDGQTDS